MTADKAIKMLERIRRTGNGESEYKNDAQAIAIDMAIEALKERKGKWIKDIYGNVVCSECRANRRDNRIGHIAFCNSCGAKMEVDE